MKRRTESSSVDFDSLFDQWNKRVYAYALKKTNSSYLAEETVQKAFIKLWRNLQQPKPEIDIERQLFCIVRTTIIDLIRTETARKRLRTSLIIPARQTASPEELLNAKEMSGLLQDAINALPEMRRKVFIMSRFENLTHKEIASRLLISPKTAENHINLALKALRKSLLSLLCIVIDFF